MTAKLYDLAHERAKREQEQELQPVVWDVAALARVGLSPDESVHFPPQSMNSQPYHQPFDSTDIT